MLVKHRTDGQFKVEPKPCLDIEIINKKSRFAQGTKCLMRSTLFMIIQYYLVDK